MTDEDDRPLIRILRLIGAFLRVTLRTLFVGLRLLVSVLRSTKNRRRARRWLLLEADRRTVERGLVGGVFAATLVLGLTDVIGVRESGFVTTMFSTIIAGLFSFVPLVIAINQLTVSRVLGTPKRLRERVLSVRSFRADVEEMLPNVAVSTTDPAGFLRLIYRAIGDRAASLEATCTGCPDAVCREEVSGYAAAVAGRAESVETHLDGDARIWSVLLPVMNDDYSEHCNEARRMRTTYDDSLPPEADDLLSELQELFVSVDVTRQYFKTMYLQQELARLSRRIAYSGVAAVLVSTLVIMIYATGYPPIVGELPLLLLVTASLAIAFSPFAILFAYVIRVATVLKRTSAPGAFTPKGERPPGVRER